MLSKRLPEIDRIAMEILPDSAIIFFNFPNERSPLTISVLETLHKILDDLKDNEKIEKIIFTGKANVFASGADLREIAKLKEKSAREFALRGQHLMQKIYNSDKMTIAAVNGFCFGGALDLAVSCKKRIASPNAVFCHPGVGLGIITGWSGTQMLPRLIGEAKALEIFLTARRVLTNEALEIGLIDEISENPLDSAINTLFN